VAHPGDSSQFVLGTDLVEMHQWKKVFGVFGKYQLAYIPTNACGYEKMSLACSTFITIEVAARGEEAIRS